MAIFTDSLIPSRSMYPHHPVYTTERKLGVLFRNPNLLKTALTHSSYLNEDADERLECNERLEFLGDAVLDLVVADALHKKPDIGPVTVYLHSVGLTDVQLQEGDMTQIRSLVVSGNTLASVARRLELGEFLLMGSGEEKGGGRNRNSNLAAVFEAIVGAIFLDKGYQAARDFCIRILDDEINSAYRKVTSAPTQTPKPSAANKTKQTKKPNTAGKHPKSALQEISQARHGKPPTYRITKATGKSNAMTFTAQVRVNGKTLGNGTGSSKKAAETAAAKAALATMT